MIIAALIMLLRDLQVILLSLQTLGKGKDINCLDIQKTLVLTQRILL